MYTAEDIKKVNAGMKFIDVKGKAYAMVNERIKAFRQICPNGGITTDIIALENGVVTMKSTVTDEDGKILGTGLAQEKETSSYINKTSFIENCESSSVGRALGMCGIGIDDSVCSAEELVNAIVNQDKPAKKTASKKMQFEPEKKSSVEVSELQVKTFKDRCEQLGQDYVKIMKQAGWKSGEDWSAELHGKALIILKEIEDEQTENA